MDLIIIKVLKALHIVAVIGWMGVLLYIPRLFIYQLEANSKTEPERSLLINQYKKMAKKLWIQVGWPAAILTIFFGMGTMHPYFTSIWFWVKMAFVVALLGYHHIIHFAYKALQKDNYNKTAVQYKSMRLAGIVFLLSIVTLAVLRDVLNELLIISGIAVGVIIIYLAVRSVIKKSPTKEEKAS